MNFSKPSTVGGGGEIRRVTSAVPRAARRLGASLGRSSRNVMSDPLRAGRPSRQSRCLDGACTGAAEGIVSLIVEGMTSRYEE